MNKHLWASALPATRTPHSLEGIDTEPCSDIIGAVLPAARRSGFTWPSQVAPSTDSNSGCGVTVDLSALERPAAAATQACREPIDLLPQRDA